MSAKISENLKEFAAYGLIAGVIGIVGYVLKAAYNMNSVADKIGKSVDEISNSVHVDVSEAIAVEAVRRAAEKEAYGIVKRASKEAVNAVRNDIQKEVREVVGKAYASVKGDVRRELERKIDALNLDDIKSLFNNLKILKTDDIIVKNSENGASLCTTIRAMSVGNNSRLSERTWRMRVRKPVPGKPTSMIFSARFCML